MYGIKQSLVNKGGYLSLIIQLKDFRGYLGTLMIIVQMSRLKILFNLLLRFWILYVSRCLKSIFREKMSISRKVQYY